MVTNHPESADTTPTRNKRRMRSWVGVVYAVLPLIIAPLIFIGAQIVMTRILQSPVQGAVAGGVITIIVASIYLYFRPVKTTITPTAPALLMPGMITGVMATVIWWWTGQVLVSWLRQAQPTLEPVAYNQAITVATVAQVLALSLIVAPIAEELLMRGIAYSALRRYLGVVASSIIAAVVFGLIHGNGLQIIVTIPLGIIAAFIVEVSGSVIAAILAHLVFNTLSVLIPHAWIEATAQSGWVLPVLGLGIATTIVAFTTTYAYTAEFATTQSEIIQGRKTHSPPRLRIPALPWFPRSTKPSDDPV